VQRHPTPERHAEICEVKAPDLTRLRALDWLLVVLAIVAVAGGFVINGPICEIPFGPATADECMNYVFPTAIVAGAGVALLAIGVLFVRARRR
jgi:hypothetical protein